MKKLTMFYLENCPHCRRAYNMIEELKNKNPNYSNVDIELVEESKNVQIASAHDYYYVPAFFLDGEKLFEGVPSIDKIEAVLKKATA
nr:thioredoxin family protein [Sedimentibacter sp.]